MGPASFHCATLLAADGLSTFILSEARLNFFGKSLRDHLFSVFAR